MISSERLTVNKFTCTGSLFSPVLNPGLLKSKFRWKALFKAGTNQDEEKGKLSQTSQLLATGLENCRWNNLPIANSWKHVVLNEVSIMLHENISKIFYFLSHLLFCIITFVLSVLFFLCNVFIIFKWIL